jgi:DNA polymerase elongation subunit (family B)
VAWRHGLHGCDRTQAIVSVEADQPGLARIWRRLNGDVDVREQAFPSWFLTTSLDLLAHLPVGRISAEALRASHGALPLADGLFAVELDDTGLGTDIDAYRFLVLTSHLQEIETTLLETYNKRAGAQAERLADLRGLVLIWPPVEQFLLLSGCTFFNGLTFPELRRLQFDLETTGLSEERDRIFMVSLRDSTGWHDCLDTRDLAEAELIERFVQLVQQRDPDVIENHNIFNFDIPFLVRRAAQLGLRLPLGRDGSEPRLRTDTFDTGERSEPFLRWTIAGRQVVDTQHAVRRYGTAAPELRRHGLKDAARHFGFAKTDREYVPGAEIWATFRTDPDRVRRYAADDVEEVDGLSRRLLPDLFGLAQLLPRPYERVTADTSPVAIWEPLLVRAYLHEGRAIGGPMVRRLERPAAGAEPEVRLRGVVNEVVQATLRPLLPCVLASQPIEPVSEALGAVQHLLHEALARTDLAGRDLLLDSAFPYLAGQSLFSDSDAASEAARIARGVLDHLLDDLRAQRATLVEIDTDRVLFAAPATWSDAVEQRVADRARAFLPDGVQLAYTARYRSVYVRGPRSRATLGDDGTLTLVGSSFRAGRLERFAERFLHRAAAEVLAGDAVALRHVFLDTVAALRTFEVPLDDLCVQVTLHRSPAEYRRANLREEPYEVLIAAGIRSWRVGQRVRYFRDRAGAARLLREDDGPANEAGIEHYVQRLRTLYCGLFAQAFERDDFERIFSLPTNSGPFDDPAADAELRLVRTRCEPVATGVPV